MGSEMVSKWVSKRVQNCFLFLLPFF
jgi:hypothetical protein